MIEKIKQEADHDETEMIAIRRHLHAHPELSFQEYDTAQFVGQKLTEWGITHERGVAGTGIVGIIEGKNSDRGCIALRADMDALPIPEQNDVPYRSVNEGVMHACGHDVHTTCLLGAARILQKTAGEWEGTVKLIFQPGEEKHPGGAKLMIEAGVLANPQPSALFALHVFPELSAGHVGFRPGKYMASADEVYITIRGKGGHAALPHRATDPISIAAQVVTALQMLVSRQADPLHPTVLSFGKIAGGMTTNVIPDQVELQGTFRAMDEKWRFQAHEKMLQCVTGICEAFGATAEVRIQVGYPSLYNNLTLTECARDSAKELLGPDHVHEIDQRMTSEDFAHYVREVPGCFLRLGTNKNNQEFLHPVHSSFFDIDEAALKTGAITLCWLAVSTLSRFSSTSLRNGYQ